MSDALWPHRLQHTRLSCLSLSPGVCSNSWPLSQWCYLTISSSATPFSFCLQSFPASGSFPKNQLLTSGGQSVGATATASVLPMNNQGWFLLRLIGLISFQSKRISRVFSSIKSINFSALSLPYGPTLTSIHGYWKNHTFDYKDLYRQSDVFAFSVYCLSLS